MKRTLLTALGAMVLALAVPSVALAHHGHRHHHHHTARGNAHHAKFRVVHIGAQTTTTPPAPSGTTTSPTTTPPTPENAGTVTSYTNNVLTLTLNDGSTVSGKVTNATRIRCVKATPTMPMEEGEDRGGPGDDNGQGDDQSRGDMSQQQGDHKDGGSDGSWQGQGGGDDDGAPATLEPPCDSSALVAGAIVRAAELRIGPGGSEFESVWLVR